MRSVYIGRVLEYLTNCPNHGMASLSASVLDIGLDKHGKVIERLLPAEIAGLDRDGSRQALLDDIDLRADRHRLQGALPDDCEARVTS